MTSRREGSQSRIPRLTYRNCPSNLSISDRSISTVRTESSTASISTCTTSPRTTSFNGSPRSVHDADTPLSPLSLDGSSERPPTSVLLSPRSAKLPKQKSSSFFSFLSVKEPSTQAFEAYQEQMKKRGTTQNGRANAVGLPGVSSAKLPSTVPKVNSKWNGVPQTAKEKVKKSDGLDRQSLYSATSRPLYTSRSTGSNMTGLTSSSSRSTSSTGSAPRSNGKLKFDNDNGNLSDMYGWETGPPSNGSSTRSLPLESRGSATLSSTLCRDSPIMFFSQSPTVPEPSCELSADIPPPLDLSSTLSSPVILPALPSPVTPSGSLHALSLSPRVDYPSGLTPAKDSSAAKKDIVVLTSSGVNVLGPPASATRRTGMTQSPAMEANSVVSQPSNAPVGTSSPQPNSILKRPNLTSNGIWPLSPPPVDQRDVERASNTPSTMSGTKSKFLSIFGKGA